MKKQILFIQGGGEGAHLADKKLANFLKDSLGDKYEINYPQMPNENEPDYEPWKSKIDEELGKIKGEVIFIGHSLGGSILIKYLSEKKLGNDICGMFFISIPFWGGDTNWQFDGFTLRDGFASIIQHANAPIFFYHSTDDDIVPFSHLGLYAEKLSKATIRMIDGRGHQLKNDLHEVVRDIKSLNTNE